MVNYLKIAKKLYNIAFKEYHKSKQSKDGSLLIRNACGKAWLSIVDATNALFIKKGLKEEELPETHRGRRFLLVRYGDRELRNLYDISYGRLHIDGYYNGIVERKDFVECLDNVKQYIQKIEEITI